MDFCLRSLASLRRGRHLALVAIGLTIGCGAGGEGGDDDAASAEESGSGAMGSTSGVTTTITSGLDTSGSVGTSDPATDDGSEGPGSTGTSGSGAIESSSGGDTTSGTAAATSDGSTSGGSTSGGSTSAVESSTGGEPNPACVAGCATQVTCNMDFETEDECVTWCEENLGAAMVFSEPCHDAWQALSACFGGLSCDEYAEYLSPSMFPYPCSGEADGLAFECDGQ